MVDYSGSFSGSFTGSILSTNGVISSSAQVIGSLPMGVISGSSQISGDDLTIDYYNLTNLPLTITPFQANSILANNALRDNFTSNVKVRLNAEDVLSGSLKGQLPVGTISSSLQLIGEFDDRYGNELNDGLVSGSAQITLLDTDRTGFDTGDVPEGSNLYHTNQRVKSLLDTEGVVSSSAQITALGFSTTDNDSQTLTIAGQTLSISNGNSIILPDGGGSGGGSSIWNTGSQDPNSYTHLMTSNNLQVTGSFDIKGALTVNGKAVFIQSQSSDAGMALEVKGRMRVLEEQIGNYIASASIQIGNSQDSIDCGGFF